MLSKRSITLVVIIVLLIALSFTTTAAIVYWTDVVQLGRVEIPIGGSEDATLQLELRETFDGDLVPQGKAFFAGEKDEVVFEYELSIDRQLAQEMNLVVKASEVLIDGSTEYAGLIRLEYAVLESNVETNNQFDEGVFDFFNELVVVVVRVRLLEPVDQSEIDNGLVFDETKHLLVDDGEAAFHAIKGKTIDLTISFRVLPKS